MFPLKGKGILKNILKNDNIVKEKMFVSIALKESKMLRLKKFF